MRRGLVILGVELTTDQIIFYGTLFLLALISLLAGLYLKMKYDEFVKFLNETAVAAITG
ncbi:hypothetical protein [Ignicoccus hospitalis]|uniref:Uncharacterized protein n=1 Tax=Ignicoccus hospitalis (strain KIN4/I / DSM 18386 / JCM 14125) TaxID=453591 RepID=A8ABN3_IGNH4|nr:hypothetical protein [Ignicoccus hospitalis]ABU82335.1 hypothetical protein Igni_1158 [Ignicoccus hospitalis KIN4/I]HIH89727.1 hypothetical protein [Desulfurococcaceae archaeon]